MPKPFKAGSKELDLAQYIELGDSAKFEQRKNAARAGFLILWGSVWSVTEKSSLKSSFTITAIDRLLAFSGDDAANDVAEEWRIIDWADVDCGSTQLLLLARANIKKAFDPRRTPSGSTYWTTVITTAKRCLVVAGLDAPASCIVPSDVLGKLDLGRKK